MRRVILPQAMRVVLPPTGNQVISMLKGTSLVSVLAISDLLYSAQIIYSLNYQTIPLLIVASCLVPAHDDRSLTFFQNKLEARYGRGFAAPQNQPADGGPGRRLGATTETEADNDRDDGPDPRGPQKSSGRSEMLKGIDLRVPKGSVTCLIGPSGSGKTTLLRCINHLENVDAGLI